jgi:hypothetical protein
MGYLFYAAFFNLFALRNKTNEQSRKTVNKFNPNPCIGKSKTLAFLVSIICKLMEINELLKSLDANTKNVPKLGRHQEEALLLFEEQRAAMRDHIEKTGSALLYSAIKHPFIGEISVYEWAWFSVAYTERHIRLMRKLLPNS